MEVKKNKKISKVSLIIILLAALISFGIVFRIKAQAPSVFGGFVTSSIPCTCNGAFLLTISPPAGGQFVYQIGTPQFPWFSLPRAGVWALGVYNPGGVCLVYVGKGCSPLGAPIGTITPVVGTSL